MHIKDATESLMRFAMNSTFGLGDGDEEHVGFVDGLPAADGRAIEPEAVVEELTLGFRVPRQIIDFAAKLLPDAAPGLLPPTSVRQQGGSLEIDAIPDPDDLLPTTITAAELALAVQEGSIGLIAADTRIPALAAALTTAGIDHTVLGAEPPAPAIEGATETEAELVESLLAESPGPRLVVVPATLAKGLEYDQVLVLEPAEIVAAEPRGLRRLYVVLTRAVSRLHVLHSAPLPPQLTTV